MVEQEGLEAGTEVFSPLVGPRTSAFFDLDGVIIQSHLAILRCLNETLRANKLPELGERQGLALIGSPIKMVFAKAIADAGGHESRAARCIADFRGTYERSFMEGTRLQIGMRDLIAQAARRIPLAVATTKPRHIAERILSELDVRQHFTIVAGPEASADGESKETTLARALLQVGLRTTITVDVGKSLMIGDRHHDIDAARANRLPVVGVLWGYGSQVELTGADAVVENCGQLLAIIEAGVHPGSKN